MFLPTQKGTRNRTSRSYTTARAREAVRNYVAVIETGSSGKTSEHSRYSAMLSCAQLRHQSSRWREHNYCHYGFTSFRFVFTQFRDFIIGRNDLRVTNNLAHQEGRSNYGLNATNPSDVVVRMNMWTAVNKRSRDALLSFSLNRFTSRPRTVFYSPCLFHSTQHHRFLHSPALSLTVSSRTT